MLNTIKRNKTKRFLSFYFPAAGHSLRRLHAMHDAPGLTYSYHSNCNSCEVIVMCPHPQFVLPRRRLHPPLDGSRPEMICLRSTFALSWASRSRSLLRADVLFEGPTSSGEVTGNRSEVTIVQAPAVRDAHTRTRTATHKQSIRYEKARARPLTDKTERSHTTTRTHSKQT